MAICIFTLQKVGITPKFTLQKSCREVYIHIDTTWIQDGKKKVKFTIRNLPSWQQCGENKKCSL